MVGYDGGNLDEKDEGGSGELGAITDMDEKKEM